MQTINHNIKILIYTLNKNKILFKVKKSKVFITLDSSILGWYIITKFIFFLINDLNINDINQVDISGRSNLLNKKIIATFNTIICLYILKK
ncbi:hypothetical protein IOLA_120 [uncultured bacterium]|nr:hypothetical protein [uncultured bacterium]BBH72436.1 hypothetical protein [uncultured bacterium]BBH72438.1 hypothetical protein [uncultured bacterium]BBH72440.1 hypothetical protein [uncultured bacterium]BBH72442.1 hypothetical protein [uncultured bacterium]